MTKIFIYDQNPGVKGLGVLLTYIDGMRYMALADEQYPFGKIIGYGRTPEKARANGLAELRKNKKTPERTLVLYDEVEL